MTESQLEGLYTTSGDNSIGKWEFRIKVVIKVV